MKTCGFLGLLCALGALFFWCITFIYWNFLLESMDHTEAMNWIMRICTAIEMLCIFGGIGIVSIGLMSARRG